MNTSILGTVIGMVIMKLVIEIVYIYWHKNISNMGH